jgi:hypothetical protein
VEPPPAATRSADGGGQVSIGTDQSFERVSIERIVLRMRPAPVPVLLLKPRAPAAGNPAKPPVVLAVAQAGHKRLLRERAADVAALLESGMAVCLPEVRGTGETSLGNGRGRRGVATAFSSSELMLGGTVLGAQLRDLRTVVAWLRTRPDLDTRKFSVWGDSLAAPNPPDLSFQVPRDDDDALPRSPEPLGGLLALLAALYEDDIRAVYVFNGMSDFQSVLAPHLALVPHDAIVPGVLTVGDLCDLVAALAPRRVRLGGLVDGWNRTMTAPTLAKTYAVAAANYGAAGAAAQLSASPQRTSPALWLGAERAARHSAVSAGLVPADRLARVLRQRVHLGPGICPSEERFPVAARIARVQTGLPAD